MAFHGDSTAGNGIFTNEAGVSDATGGFVEFYDNSTAGTGTFTNEGGGNKTENSRISFFDNSNAGNGTFIIRKGRQCRGNTNRFNRSWIMGF